MYATLLVATAWLLAPGAARGGERWLQRVVSWPVRACALALMESPPEPVAGPGEQRAEQVRQALWRRWRAAAIAGTSGRVPGGHAPVLCRVVERGVGSTGTRISRLVLDIGAEQAADCVSFVTYGDQLVGFLEPPTSDGGLAEVSLLCDTTGGARRVPAMIDLAEGPTRLLVEPEEVLAPWTLRCRLLEEPYAAAELQHGGHSVVTAALAGDPWGVLPAGLRIGRLRVLGYPGRPGAPAIDLLVESPRLPRALSVVVVWRRADVPPQGRSRDAAMVDRAQLVALPAPPPGRQRWLLRARDDVDLHEGAAVLADGRLLGVVDRGGRGGGIAASFADARGPWSLVLMPDDPRLSVLCLVADVVSASDDGTVRLACRGRQPELPRGQLFTGTNGIDSPLGLWIGPVVPVVGRDYDLLAAVARVDGDGDGEVAVCRGGEKPR